MFLFGLGLAEAVKGFQALEPVALLCTSKCLYKSGSIIGKGEEVPFSREFHWVYGANKVSVYELIRLLCSFLGLSIVHFCCFGLLAAITDVPF